MCEEASDAVHVLAGKWTLAVMTKLDEQPMRHTQLHKALDNTMSDKMLTRVLRRLEEAGIIARQVRTGGTLGVEYRLLPFGRALFEPLAELASIWRNSLTESTETEDAQQSLAS